VLDTINARIEYLLDRDHAIGHAFFMGDGGRDLAAIDDTMRFKIIPLLQEYFFDDWRNIAAVLGKGFVRGETLPVPPGIEHRGERTRWTIRWQEPGNDGFPSEAYDLLLKGTEAEVDRSDMTEAKVGG
jgi:5-methylcytosine-specific restriction protein B